MEATLAADQEEFLQMMDSFGYWALVVGCTFVSAMLPGRAKSGNAWAVAMRWAPVPVGSVAFLVIPFLIKLVAVAYLGYDVVLFICRAFAIVAASVMAIQILASGFMVRIGYESSRRRFPLVKFFIVSACSCVPSVVYLSASDISMCAWKRVNAESILSRVPSSVHVMYVSLQDDSVVTRPIRGAARNETIAKLSWFGNRCRLVLEHFGDRTDIKLYDPDNHILKFTTIGSMDGNSEHLKAIVDADEYHWYEYVRRVPSSRPDFQIKVLSGTTAYSEISYCELDESVWKHKALVVPWWRELIGNCIVVADSIVLVQIGRRDVYLIDMKNGEIAWLLRGSGATAYE